MNQNILLPLDKFIEKSAVKEDWQQEALERFRVDGHTYGIPGLEGGPIYSWIWNQDLFEEVGLPGFDPNVPPTWDEVIAAHKRLTRVGGDGDLVSFGFDPGEEAAQYFENIMYLFDVPVDTETGLARINSQPVINALTLLYEEFRRPYPGYEKYMQGYGAWAAGGDSRFANRRTAMMLGAYYVPGALKNTMPDGRIGITWAPNDDGTRIQRLGGWGIGIPAGAPNLEETWAFLEYMVSPQATARYFEQEGWLGGMLDRTLPEYIDVRQVPGVDWFLRSLNNADRVLVFPPSPVGPGGFVQTAQSQVFSGNVPPQTALEEAQRLMEVAYQEYMANQAK